MQKVATQMAEYIFILLLTCLGAPLFAEVRLWPVPKQEAVSDLWTVQVNGTETGVLSARTADAPFDKNYDHGGPYALVSLDADEPVVLTLKSLEKRSLDKLQIRPASLNIKPVIKADGSIEIKVNRACQFSVEPDGRRRPLLVFVNEPEKNIPPKGDPNVIWFGPGIHRPEKIELKSNQTLYLEAGAIVQSGIRAKGENIRICGRGMIDNNPWPWRKCPTGMVLNLLSCKNLTVEGIMIRGAAHWTVVPQNCEEVMIDNIKICGGRVQNDDGINPCNSRRVSIKNCFIRTDDDCIAVKGLYNELGNAEDITVEHCVFWGDRARIVLLGHESRAPYMRRILFRDCDAVHSRGRTFVFEPGEEMRLEEILFENFRFEMENFQKENTFLAVRPVINQYMKNKVPGHVADITFRDFKLTGDKGSYKILVEDHDPDHQSERIVLENIDYFGEKLTPNSVQLGSKNCAGVSVINPAADPDGFKRIFDGQSLKGWHGDPGYVCEDGKIVMKKGTKKHFYADPEYANFILRLDYRFEPGGNSGIALRSPSTQKDEPAYVAMEIQVLDDSAPKHEKIKQWQHNGSLYGIVPAKLGFCKPAGQWNHYEITVQDYCIRVCLNGHEIVKTDLEKSGFTRLLNKPGETLKRRLGHVGFTGHGDTNIEFKNLSIKTLD